DGVLNDVVDRAQGDVAAEAVVEMVDDAAIGTAAMEQQREDVLPQPLLGDGQLQEDVVVVRRWRGEGLRQGLLGAVELLVHELAADAHLLGPRGDGYRAAERWHRQVLPLFWLQELGGIARRGRGRGDSRRGAG